MQKDVIYHAEVKNGDEVRKYMGSTSRKGTTAIRHHLDMRAKNTPQLYPLTCGIKNWVKSLKLSGQYSHTCQHKTGTEKLRSVPDRKGRNSQELQDPPLPEQKR